MDQWLSGQNLELNAQVQTLTQPLTVLPGAVV